MRLKECSLFLDMGVVDEVGEDDYGEYDKDDVHLKE